MNCSAITKSGKPCSRKAKFAKPGFIELSLCGQHYNISYKVKKKEVIDNYKEDDDEFVGDDDNEVKDEPKIQAPDAIGEDHIYISVLGKYLFGNIEPKEYRNFYITKDSNITSTGRTKRLTREMKFIKSNLPFHFNSSIAIRFNSIKPYFCTAIIFAPNNTPYDSGCFQFDIYIPPEYPNTPPLVQIMTTGNGTVRFSPNLYANGRVCLSLLGTWRGLNKSQEWNKKTSNLWQVLVSIQSAILGSEYPYFDEPGAEREIGTDKGNIQRRIAVNGGYERLREATVKYAMTNYIINPSKGFEELIHGHFRIKRDYIRSVCFQWLEEAKLSATIGHYARLKHNVDELEKELVKL